MGSDEARPGRSGDDTGTDQAGEGAEFSVDDHGSSADPAVTDDDVAARRAAAGGADAAEAGT